MKIEITEEEIKKIYRACMQRSYRFAEKALEADNDMVETDRRIRDEYKALAEKNAWTHQKQRRVTGA